MLKRLALITLMGALYLCAAENHPAKGIVLKTDLAHGLLVVSCEAIPGYMDAMEMEFTVHEPKILAGLKAGAAVNFTIVAHGQKLYAEDIREGTTANFESEPMAAGQLTALNSMLDPAAKALAVGQHVPDFALTDQAGNTIHLAQFQGKVVAVTFGYSRCPNPNYCYRLSNNLARVEQRFRNRAGRDLILITIMIDPEHDQGATLAQYAGVWKADPANWHFLTGPLPEIKQVAGMFGMNFWSAEGLLTHSLHTVIVDRQGQLAVNLEGNQFTPQELGDLVRTVMDRQ
ncbi:MAG TPA: SCO family protein [Bryobacteraceae bacterium]|nr:SCO family protein [Bryobacteraceae bacterium]